MVKYSIDDLEKAINNSIERQINADVKVGAHLSGGIDSSHFCHDIKTSLKFTSLSRLFS